MTDDAGIEQTPHEPPPTPEPEATEPEAPSTEPESSSPAPETPVTEPELEATPVAPPEAATSEPEPDATPAAPAEAATTEPEPEAAVAAQPEAATTEPEVPVTEPEPEATPAAPPEATATEPEPEVPSVEPESTPHAPLPNPLPLPLPLPSAGSVPAGPPPETYGRVDPDGTVWVRAIDGEVQVGQFQAGSPDEALAYYARKYTALETEVALLEKRLISGADVHLDDAAATVTRIWALLETPQVVGDIDGLRIRVNALTPALEARRAKDREDKARGREAAKAAREAIVAEAEALVESTSWKSSGDRLRVLLDEWKGAPRVDRGTEQAMWKRFSAARNAFDRRRRAHFAKLSTEQAEAKATKQAIVKEAEALSGSTEWGPTAAEYRRLMDRWKATGRASRSDDDALWTRFRSAQDVFFSARSATFDARDAGQADNLKAKQALADEADELLPVGDLASAKAALRSIQERWEKVGHVPRTDKERVESRLRRVEQAVRDAEDRKWKRTNPEARARAEATIEQLNEVIAKLEKQLAAANAAGDAAKITAATEGLEARQAWLAEAQRALEEFSGE